MKTDDRNDEFIIEYAQKILGISRSELKYPPHILRFLALILSEEAMLRFSPIQYNYAANFIYGRPFEASSEEAVKYLKTIKKAYESHYEFNSRYVEAIQGS